MSLQPFEAMKKICAASSWTISNLELQKLLFLAQKDFWKHHDEKLISVFFEAWEYGPVVPELYRAAKRFGADPIESTFLSGVKYGSNRLDDALITSYEKYREASPGRLVALTHKPFGAWDKNYKPNILGVPIPDRDVKSEARGDV